jgi:hypothetical protein
MTVTNETGTILTCANEDCTCRLRIEEPCPHGDAYRCGCGHEFQDAASGPLADTPA